MKFIVYGAGAIGAYFGGRLVEAKQDVTFFVRQRRAEQLSAHGLRLESPEGAFTAHVQVATTVEEVQQADVILVAVKGYHLKEALPQIIQLAKQTNAYVLPLLNGIEHVTHLQQALGEEQVLGGFASIIATLNEQGHVLHTSGSSAIQIGTLHPSQRNVIEAIGALQPHVHTNIIVNENIRKGMWSKYMFITAFSGITAATQQPAQAIIEQPATEATAKQIVYEMGQIARLEGVAFSDEEIEKEASRLVKFKPHMTSSMHQDLRKGLPIEVEHLHGGALRIAHNHDIKLPTIATIYGILKPYEHGQLTTSR